MKKIILALFVLFVACTAAGAQTGCTVGGGVTCSPNLDLWLLPPHYQNWGIPWNDNATAVDTFSTSVVLLSPAGSQTITEPFSSFLNMSNPLVFGSVPNIRFGVAAGTYDTILSRGGAGIVSFDTTTPGNGAGTIYAGGLKVNGSGGTTGQCLGSNGTLFNTPVNCAVSGAIYYQTAASNGTAQTQRPTLNFSSYFTLTDSSSPAQTTATPVTTGSEGKLVTAAAAGTSGNCTQWDASGGLGDAGAPCLTSLTLQTLARVHFNSCALGDDGTGGSGSQCTQSWGTTLSGTYYWWCQTFYDAAAGCTNLGDCASLTVNAVSQTSTTFTYAIDTRVNTSRGNAIPMTCWASN